MAFDLNAFVSDAWNVFSRRLDPESGWIARTARQAIEDAASRDVRTLAEMGSVGRWANATGHRLAMGGGLLKNQIAEAWRGLDTTGGRAALVAMGALTLGGSLYAFNDLRRGDYMGATMGAGVAGLGAWLMLRNGIGPGLAGVMSAYEKQLVSARAAFLNRQGGPSATIGSRIWTPGSA